MKKRNGFVSNSSSASFICNWRSLSDDCLESDLIELFDSYNGKLNDMSATILGATSVMDTSYQTKMFTSMYNDMSDVPADMAYLVTALNLKSGFELIDIAIEDE